MSHATQPVYHQVIVPLPKKGDLCQMTNSPEISLLSTSAKAYNKILFTESETRSDLKKKK